MHAGICSPSSNELGFLTGHPQQGFLEGKSATEAALNAARLRFRPIVMTSLAFVFGVLPLMFASGAGAAARRSMGTGVVGGMLLATFVATVFIPLSDAQQLAFAGQPLATSIATKGVPQQVPAGTKVMSNAQVISDLQRPL